MKKLLIAGVAALTLAVPAEAQLFGPGNVVFDPTAVGKLLEQIGIQGSQLDQLVQTYNQVVQVYNQTTNVWHAVEGVAGAAEWAPGLRSQLAMNPLPYAADSHPGWVGGFNDPSGIPYGAVYQSQNTVGGDPSVFNDGTFAGQELLKSIRSYSSIMGVANNGMLSIEQRLGSLSDLFNQLDALPKLFATGQLQARLNTELNYANSQNTQATQTMSAITMQKAVFENNQTQWTYLDQTNGITAACGIISQISFAACNGSPAGGAPLPSTTSTVAATTTLSTGPAATATAFVPGTDTPIAPGG
jgi:hypothetical protein